MKTKKRVTRTNLFFVFLLIRKKSVLHVQICFFFFLLIRKKVCCTCNDLFFLLIGSIDLDAIFIAVPF